MLSPKCELVLLVGYPSMGRSTLYRKHFGPAEYRHISQDSLGSRAKCIKATEEALAGGKSCVIGELLAGCPPCDGTVDLVADHTPIQTTRTGTGKHGSTTLGSLKSLVSQSGKSCDGQCSTLSFVYVYLWWAGVSNLKIPSTWPGTTICIERTASPLPPWRMK